MFVATSTAAFTAAFTAMLTVMLIPTFMISLALISGCHNESAERSQGELESISDQGQIGGASSAQEASQAGAQSQVKNTVNAQVNQALKIDSESATKTASESVEKTASESVEKLADQPEKPKKPKKPKRCRRGIHKGRKECLIKRGYINLYHINRNKRHSNLQIINDKRQILPEARKVMLDFLGDWRAKEQCKPGYSFNYDYKGGASWRMYKCNVQDRLLWYLYLVGHHFDSEIQIVSGLRAHERKTSRHHNGHAVDFRVRGVPAKEVWEYCKQTFPLVGVGYYPKTRFVHLDVGRDHHQAYWVDSSGSGESASYKNGVSQYQRGRARKSQAGMIASIQRSLKRHYAKFKERRARYQKRKAERERKRKARAKRRKARAKRRKSKSKRGKSKSKRKSKAK